jgi:cytoskeletal protein CcmA (bactofilin family)
MIFKSDSSSSKAGDLNGFLDAGSHIQGELHFDDTFRVDGKVTGKIISQGDLVVGERGEISGEILVARVYISGTVKGTIKDARRVELTRSGRLLAEIETQALVVEEGGFFEGQCSMQRPAAVIAETPREAPRAVVTPMPRSS